MANPDRLTPDVKPDDIAVEASRVAGAVEIFPPTRGHVTPLIDGEAAFREMFRAISAARLTIEIAIWYIQLDTILKGPGGATRSAITALLQDRAKAGVKIRILVSYLECFMLGGDRKKPDEFGFCLALSAQKICDRLRNLHPNIEAEVALHPYVIAFRNKKLRPGCSHEKMVLVDGKTAFCGGLEFTKDYTNADPGHRGSTRHDVHAMLEGPVVDHFAQHFAERWKRVTGKAADRPKGFGSDPKRKTHAVQVGITRSVPHGLAFENVQRDILAFYRDAIEKAEKLIYIENQYFRSPDLTGFLIAKLKKQRNLSVIVILPEQAEEKPSRFSAHADFVQATQIQNLRKASNRAEVFSLRRSSRKGGGIYVHAKVMVVDDRWITIGSANTNPRSFYLDDEINFALRDDTWAAMVRRALCAEHLQLKPARLAELEQTPRFDLLTHLRSAAADTRAQLRLELPVANRFILHNPPPGKKLDVSEIESLDFLEKLFFRLQDIDQFVGDFPRGDTAVV